MYVVVKELTCTSTQTVSFIDCLWRRQELKFFSRYLVKFTQQWRYVTWISEECPSTTKFWVWLEHYGGTSSVFKSRRERTLFTYLRHRSALSMWAIANVLSMEKWIANNCHKCASGDSVVLEFDQILGKAKRPHSICSSFATLSFSCNSFATFFSSCNSFFLRVTLFQLYVHM